MNRLAIAILFLPCLLLAVVLPIESVYAAEYSEDYTIWSCRGPLGCIQVGGSSPVNGVKIADIHVHYAWPDMLSSGQTCTVGVVLTYVRNEDAHLPWLEFHNITVTITSGAYMPSSVVSSASDTGRTRVAPGGSYTASIVLQVPRNDGPTELRYLITFGWSVYDGVKDFFKQTSGDRPLVVMASPSVLDVTFNLGNVTTTSMRVDNSVQNVVDGRLNLSIQRGTDHTFVLPETVDMGPGVRAVFRRFSGLPASAIVQPSSPSRFSLHVWYDVNVIAVYDLQYYLTILNDKGASTGAGWYDSGSVARFSISRTTGLLITQDFDHWEGDYSGSSSSGSLTMDQPKKLTAVWHTGYWELCSLVLLILAVAGAGLMIARMRGATPPHDETKIYGGPEEEKPISGGPETPSAIRTARASINKSHETVEVKSERRSMPPPPKSMRIEDGWKWETPQYDSGMKKCPACGTLNPKQAWKCSNRRCQREFFE